MYEELLTSQDVMAAILDNSGNITCVNDDYIRISGFSREELLSTPHNLFYNPQLPKLISEDIAAFINRKHTWNGLIKHQTKSEVWYWAHVKILPIVINNDEVCGYRYLQSKPHNTESIQDAEKLLFDINTGCYSDFLRYGEPLKKGFKNTISRKFHSIKIRERLNYIMLFCIFSTFTVFNIEYLSLHSNYQTGDELKNIENISYRIRSLQIDAYSLDNIEKKAELEHNSEILENELKNYIINTKLTSTQFKKYESIKFLLSNILILLLVSLFKIIIDDILKEMSGIRHVVSEVSNKNYSINITHAPNNEVGVVMESLRLMTANLTFQQADAKRLHHKILRLKTGLDCLNTGVIIVDIDRVVVYVNDSATSLFKCAENEIRKSLPFFTANDIIGKNIDQFHKNPKHQEELIANLTNTFNTYIKLGDIKIFVRVSPIINELGRRLGAIAEIEDITEKEAQAQALSTAYEEKKAAEELAESKANFLANMSHEIRTPMNAVIGMSYLLSQTQLSNTQYNYLQKVQTASQHLLGIINDILDLSKIESGAFIIEYIDFRLETVLHNVSNLISQKVKEKGLQLHFDIDDKLPFFLNGDPLRLGQILINYANNAVKFTEKGSITISVKLLEETSHNMLLYFSVTDTGIGLTSEEKSKLFQSFQQADMSTSRKYGGTGLGLSISKKLSTLMKGEVGVDSEVGKGSRFWFSARLNKSQRLLSYIPNDTSLFKRKVLVIDNNEISRHFLGNTLMSFGLDVTKASTSKEALKYLSQPKENNFTYEIIFLHWAVDNQNTSKLVMELQNYVASTHIVAITQGREEVINEIKVVGINHFLIEPFNHSSLFNITMRLLGELFDEIDNDNFLEEIEHPVISDKLQAIRGSSILLVEDIIINQEIACVFLTKEGFLVDVAENGIDAIDMLFNKTYDLVLMDMQMPIMDGVSATIEIRKNTMFDQLPIIAMTANAMESDKLKCLKAGMNDFITKPIDVNKILNALVKWIPPKFEIVTTKNTVFDLTKEENREGEDIFLPDIEGLDVELGLERIFGNKKFYLKMLHNYINNQDTVVEDIRESLRLLDYDTAERIAHSSKGVSGNIGATQLQKMAESLETSINQKLPMVKINSLLSEFELVQSKMLAEINDAISSTSMSENVNNINILEAKDVMNNLKELLIDQDISAVKLFEKNSRLLELFLGVDIFSNIRKEIKNFDFDNAIKILEKIT